MTAIINGVNDLEKIDSVAVSGLDGTYNILAYKVHEIERHLHSGARWFEKAATPTATHIADRIGLGAGHFEIDAGNDAWGDWAQILGSGDTPVSTGMAYFDPHLMVIAAAERTAIYFVQIGRGASGAAALTAGTYTELVFDTTSKAGGTEVPVQTGRAPAGSLLWARCMCPSQDTATFDFYFGIHEYEG